MEKRKCIKCGANIAEEDVIKLVFEDGSSEILPLTTCPTCFREQMRKKAIG